MLHHAPGHAQADFGEALVVIGGIEQKAHFFALDLPHSDASYIQCQSAAKFDTAFAKARRQGDPPGAAEGIATTP
jgi:transposase